MSEGGFVDAMKLCLQDEDEDEDLTVPLKKLFQYIEAELLEEEEQEQREEGKDDEKDDEFIHEMRSEFSPEIDANRPTDDEYQGYRDFVVWCEDWRNVQHRLRHLTFVICKYLNQCQPSIIEVCCCIVIDCVSPILYGL